MGRKNMYQTILLTQIDHNGDLQGINHTFSLKYEMKDLLNSKNPKIFQLALSTQSD